MKKLHISVMLLISLIIFPSPSASAAVKPGEKCSSIGIKEIYKGKSHTCIKSGEKLMWDKGVNVGKYDAAFAAAILDAAKIEAAQILADAKLKASQISSRPNCVNGNSKASVSIGVDPSTKVIALIYENSGICDLIIRASAEFYCPGGVGGRNTVVSRGTFTLRSSTKVFVSLSPERYFPLVIAECLLVTGKKSNSISVANESIRRVEPTISVEAAVFSGNFNQVDASNKAKELIKNAEDRAKKILSDAKNPDLLLKAWAAASEKVSADKFARNKCEKDAICPLGSTGPGGGIVFYDAGTQYEWGRYLEVAPAGWNGGTNDPAFRWAADSLSTKPVLDIEKTYPIKNDTMRIGLGLKNSNAIVAQGNDENTAAGAARAYRGGSQTDWYLPSATELNLLCQWARNIPQSVNTQCKGGMLNTGTGGNGGFQDKYPYWSSTESGQIDNVSFIAWYQSFRSGTQDYWNKNTSYCVRPIRSF